MDWKLEDAIVYYQKQGAPRDQTVLTALLREIQQENGGSIPVQSVVRTSEMLGVKESLLLALIRRIPSLRLSDRHCLEICAGPNCGKHRQLAEFAEKNRKAGIELKFVPCMRMCAKGPNIRLDGRLYHKVDPAQLKALLERL